MLVLWDPKIIIKSPDVFNDHPLHGSRCLSLFHTCLVLRALFLEYPVETPASEGGRIVLLVVLMGKLRLREARLIFGPRSLSGKVKQACLACESLSLTTAMHGPLSFFKALFM